MKDPQATAAVESPPQTQQAEEPIQPGRAAQRRRVQEKMAQKFSAPSPVVDNKGRLHEPGGTKQGGQYLPGKTEPSAAEPTPADVQEGAVAPAPASVEGGEEKQAVDEPASGFVRIPLDESHPLRDRGRTYIDVPASDEEVYRSMVKGSARRRDVATARQESERMQAEADHLRRENARMMARIQAIESGELRDEVLDPKMSHLLQEAEKWDPETAKKLREALDAKRQLAIQSREAEALRYANEHIEGETFTRRIGQLARLRGYQVWDEPTLMNHMVAELHQYYAEVEHMRSRVPQGMDPSRAVPLNQDLFLQRLDRRYVSDPNARQAIQSWKTEQENKERERFREEARLRARQEFEQEEKKRLQEAADRHGRLPPAPTPADVQRRGPAEDDMDEVRNLPPGQRQKFFKGLLRGRLAERGP